MPKGRGFRGAKVTTRFEKIPIDKTSISQGELNIDNKIRSNLFAWNGQFSPQFVEVLLTHYAEENNVVIDPFVGSGTTLCEAARKGISAYGMELNASALARSNTAVVLDLLEETLHVASFLILPPVNFPWLKSLFSVFLSLLNIEYSSNIESVGGHYVYFSE